MSMVPAPATPRRAGRPAQRPATSRPALTVVQPRPSTPARMPFILLVAAILTAGLVTLLLLNTALSQGSFEVTDLQQRAALLADREQALAQELARNESPAQLAASAGKLGMVPSRSPVFLRISDGTVLGEPQPGATVAPPAPDLAPDPAPATSSKPSAQASAKPAPEPAEPSAVPAAEPSAQASAKPASKPTEPSAQPAAKPAAKPAAQPAAEPSPPPGGEIAMDPGPGAAR